MISLSLRQKGGKVRTISVEHSPGWQARTATRPSWGSLLLSSAVKVTCSLYILPLANYIYSLHSLSHFYCLLASKLHPLCATQHWKFINFHTLKARAGNSLPARTCSARRLAKQRSASPGSYSL